jgi:6-phosphofructokinase 1
MKRIGVYTSGGDSPGMNAAIRAVVRTAVHHEIEVFGIYQGYVGMLQNQIRQLHSNDMANVLKNGGTLLKTGRSTEFMQQEARSKAAQHVRSHGIEGLICIGGDGSFRGAHLLSTENGIPVVGIPATIDNDIFGTDQTIGFDTAMNTAVEAIDRIRDTAASHDRLFIVEVMGRDSGFLAVEAGLAGGAEEIFFAENPVTVDDAIEHIKKGLARGKKSSILIAAEGHKPGRAYDLAESIRKKAGFDSKVCVLGHVQRGGAPTAGDRVLASRMGAAGVDALRAGQSNVMIALQNGKLVYSPLQSVLQGRKQVPKDLVLLAQLLST